MVKTVIDKLMRWRERALLAVLAALLLLALLGVIDLIRYSVTSSFLVGAQAAANDFGRPLLSVVFALLVLACLVEPTSERSRRVARSSVLVIGISLAAGVLFALIGYLGSGDVTYFFAYLADHLVTALALLVVFTVGKALPAPEPKPGRGSASGQQQGQGYPGQNYPGQNYPGQGQQGQNYPGQGQQGQNYPGQGQQGQGQQNQGQQGQGYQGHPGQSQEGQGWSGPTGQGPQDQGGQPYAGQSYGGGQSYGAGQSYGEQSYGQSQAGPPASQPSASQGYQPYPDHGQQGGPASAQSAGYPESDHPAQAPRGEWGSSSYSQPPNAFPPPNGPSSAAEFPPTGETAEDQSAQSFGSTQYRDPDEQVRQFGPSRSQSDPAPSAEMQSHAAPAGGPSDDPAAVTDHGDHQGEHEPEDDQPTEAGDDVPADDQTRIIPAVPDQSGDDHDLSAAPSAEDDHGRTGEPEHVSEGADDEAGHGADQPGWNGPQT